MAMAAAEMPNQLPPTSLFAVCRLIPPHNNNNNCRHHAAFELLPISHHRLHHFPPIRVPSSLPLLPLIAVAILFLLLIRYITTTAIRHLLHHPLHRLHPLPAATKLTHLAILRRAFRTVPMHDERRRQLRLLQTSFHQQLLWKEKDWAVKCHAPYKTHLPWNQAIIVRRAGTAGKRRSRRG